MEYSDTNIQDIKKNFMYTLKCLSNKVLQEELWVPGNGEGERINFPGYIDLVCDFPATCELIIKDDHKFGLKIDEKKTLMNLHNSFNSFSKKNYLPELFIDNPEWTEITEMAKEVLKAFNDSDAGIEKPSLFRGMKTYLQRFFRKFNA